MLPKINQKFWNSNLLIFRHCLAMTADELGKLMGVTRQSINNFEHERNVMTISNVYALLYIAEHVSLSKKHKYIVDGLIKAILDENETELRKYRLITPSIYANKNTIHFDEIIDTIYSMFGGK
jgi:DNA-binding XRE family transcriptional regulator